MHEFENFSDLAPVTAIDSNVADMKIPPHSIEAEQSVLGGLMLSEQAWDRIADKIVEADFYRAGHQYIFRALASLADRGEPKDVVTVSEWLEKANLLDDAGRLEYLTTLARETPSAKNIEAYAKIVHERSVLRKLVEAGENVAGMARNTEGRSARDVLDEAERSIFQIAEGSAKNSSGFVAIKELMGGAIERIDEMFENGDAITGLSTGLSDFDKMTSGFQGGDLVIVAGRPAMGKTTLAMNWAEHVVIREKTPVAVFSMEMPGEQLAMRMISSFGRIDQTRMRSGNLSDEDWPRITSAVSIISEAPLYIDDTPALTPTEVRARCRRLKRQAGGLGMVVIDYLQLMQVAGNTENRATEISEISRSLKGLAKELHCPVIALSQLNRSLEQRPNKRPVMSDLRESGAIEQDADIIVFVYRDEVYNKETADKGIGEVIIGKQRNGPIGTVRTAFHGRYTRFEDLAPEVY